MKVGRSKDSLKQFINLIYMNRLKNIKEPETLNCGKKNTKHLLSRLGDMNRYIHNEYKPHENSLIYCFMIL